MYHLGNSITYRANKVKGDDIKMRDDRDNNVTALETAVSIIVSVITTVLITLLLNR